MQSTWKYWSLITDKGRQYWEFNLPEPLRQQHLELGDGFWDTSDGHQLIEQLHLEFTFNTTANPNSADRVYRAKQVDPDFFPSLPPDELKTSFSEEAWEAFVASWKGFDFYQHLQTPDGNWPGDYGGPHFLIPGFVIVAYVTKTKIERPVAELIKRYLINHQNSDGGWGMHIEGDSTMFGTALQYVSLRLLGCSAHEPYMQKARTWIQNQGGALGIPSWGKFYLAVLGVFEWDGCNSLLPELWILPKGLPMHPGRYWCHCRMVYLPMSYAYGVRLTGAITPLIHEIRSEIYTQPYTEIRWSQARDTVAKVDLYFPPSALMKVVNPIINSYEKWHLKAVRKKALAEALKYIDAEDDHTNFIDIGPVNKVINALCVWHAHGPDSERFKQHVNRFKDYLWLAEDGIKMNGYNGSQLWDTAFAAQAMLEAGLVPYFGETTQKIYKYLEMSQVKTEVRDHKRFYRHDSVGGWPFSTADHGWPISDCTAEGLKTSLQLNNSVLFSADETPAIVGKRLTDAVDVLLSFQNADGGWASYENTRGPAWLEKMNPSEIFGEIMVDYSYTECSSACMQALCTFAKYNPNYRAKDIEQAVARGVKFVRGKQRADGSWYGSWAVCFTYGTWFGVEALVQAGANTLSHHTPDPALIKACAFLKQHQNADGGWGESFQSCVTKTYVPHNQSQVVNTAWALLTLMAADEPDKHVILRGIRFLLQMQLDNGDWPQQGISGVFNHNCMITYTAYRNVFPLWALGRFAQKYAN